MYETCLILIGITAIAIATEGKTSSKEQEELIPIPVRANEKKS